ncbi:MAG: hypothetical protein LBV43_04705 [Prevotella sp.]|jgi:hypothetical protein|nr:hypothetical protein [Prevotella sp.]
MKKISLLITVWFAFSVLHIYGQQSDSIANKLIGFASNFKTISHYLPQEKVYLHFDNTSYYIGDNIWFKGYVTTSALHEATTLSKVLYIDLLDQDGHVVDTRKLKIEEGQCHGDFSLSDLKRPGMYEIRAYTKYMLNFGEEYIFSRVFPIYNKPKEDGNYEERDMRIRNRSIEFKERGKSEKLKNLNFSIYPEGGSLVDGLESRIAFVATDKSGQPVNITGQVIDSKNNNVLSTFSSEYKGKGAFSFHPQGGKYKVKIESEAGKQEFDLPAVQPKGYVMTVNNVNADSITVKVKKNNATFSSLLGLVSTTRNELITINIIDFAMEDACEIKVPADLYSGGVSQFILFDLTGQPLAERMFFVYPKNELRIESTQSKDTYQPYEKISIDFRIADNTGKPLETGFSLSVRDADNQMEPIFADNILSNLLLSSDLKGYIDNPSYYFESDDMDRKNALDLLMMTQGWSRYNWQEMTGIKPLEMKYKPEKGILIDGIIKSWIREKPVANTTVSMILSEKNDPDNVMSTTCKTDDKGMFSIYTDTDINGTWTAIFQTSEQKTKKKEVVDEKKRYHTLLNTQFRPDIRPYTIEDLSFKEKENGNIVDSDKLESLLEGEYEEIQYDTLSLAMDQKVHHLKEIEITAKENAKMALKKEHLKKANIVYDAQKEMDDMTDRGEYMLEKDVDEYLASINGNFHRTYTGGDVGYTYKGGKYYYVYNDISVWWMSTGTKVVRYTPKEKGESSAPMFDWVQVADIDSLAISESREMINKYIPIELLTDPDFKDVEYKAVVFIYLFPGTNAKTRRKGIRRTRVHGYTPGREFYSPDYGELPPEPDYRRTLYWNPNVKTDEEGRAEVSFYNNGTGKQIIISAEIVTADGQIGGLYKE